MMRLVACWALSLTLIGLGIASKENAWLFTSLIAASVVLNVLIAAILAILRKSSEYWTRQSRRATTGLDVEPEPWYVRLTIRSHESRLLKRMLG